MLVLGPFEGLFLAPVTGRGRPRSCCRATLPTGLLLGLAFASGCVESRILSENVPDDVRWVVAIRLAADNTLETWTPLADIRAPDFAGLPLEQHDELVTELRGFSEEQLAPYFPPELGPEEQRELARSEPPRSPVEPCEPTLPPPKWAVQLSAGQSSSIDLEGLAKLSPLALPFSVGICPALSPDAPAILVDSQCSPESCLPTAQTGCSVPLETEHCGQLPLSFEGTVLPTGALCGAPTPGQSGGCVPVPLRRKEAVASLECRIAELPSCYVDLFPSGGQPPAVNVELIELFEAPLAVPERSDADGYPHIVTLREGYLADLLVLENRVVVAGAEQARPGFGCAGSTQRASTLWILDAEGMGLLGSIAHPGCVIHLIQDPANAGGFIALTREVDGFVFVRFDREGAILSRHAVSLTATDENEVWPVGLEWLEDVGAFVVGVFRPSISDVAPVELTLVAPDFSSSDPRVIGGDALRPITKLAKIDGHRVGFLTSYALHINVFDAERGGVAQLNAAHRGNTENLGIVWHPRSKRLLASIAGTSPRVVGADLPEETATAVGTWMRFYETEAQPTAAIPHPRVPNLALVTVSAGPPSWDSSLAFLDPSAGYFIPGIAPLDLGPITELQRDDQGRVWAISPWTSRVARIEVSGP